MSSSSNRLQRGKWHIISIVIDCIESTMEVYLDAKCTHQQSDTIRPLNPSGMVFDGVYSIGGEVYLFGDGSLTTQEGNLLYYILLIHYLILFCLI